jgi:hypothetical protein
VVVGAVVESRLAISGLYRLISESIDGYDVGAVIGPYCILIPREVLT